MPRLDAIPPGCAFHPRCPDAFPRCRLQTPPPMPTPGGFAACWLAEEDA
jgi:peptide/nickel transport system ATP-binding protein